MKGFFKLTAQRYTPKLAQVIREHAMVEFTGPTTTLQAKEIKFYVSNCDLSEALQKRQPSRFYFILLLLRD